MLNRSLSIFLTLVAFVLILNFHPVSAKNQKNEDFTPPEIEGTYDVPGRPNVKVRVFVYRAKGKGGGKPAPSPTPTPTIACFLPDNNSSAVVDAAGWHLPGSWVYNLNSGSVPASVGGDKLPAIAAKSFTVWTDAISGGVLIGRGADTGANRSRFDGQNIIAWGRISRSALAITYTWYYTDSHEVADVDTIMNNSYPWSWSNGDATCAYPNSYDAQNILTHELGHWMGLDDMYTDGFKDNTMYGYGSVKEVKKNTLTTGDEDGVKGVYKVN